MLQKLVQNLFLFSLCFWVFDASAQIQWYDPLEYEEVIQGRLFEEKNYHRLPSIMQESVRQPVWNLAQQSAGLYLDFITDASMISLEYQVHGPLQFPHMPATGVSGLDLYVINEEGNYDWVRGKYSFGDTIRYQFELKQAKIQSQEFRLFLPLYNSIAGLRLGVEELDDFQFLHKKSSPPIVVYGTSIAQGACASRAGMAWTAILMRALKEPVVNLGFSGNGLLEKELVDWIGETKASLFILDCLPNMQPGINMSEPEMRERIQYSVKSLKEKQSETPIILVYHAGLGDSKVDLEKSEQVIFKNRLLQEEFESLKEQGITGLFILNLEEIGLNEDDFVDGIHPTDGGMKKYSDAFIRKVSQIRN